MPRTRLLSCVLSLSAWWMTLPSAAQEAAPALPQPAPTVPAPPVPPVVPAPPPAPQTAPVVPAQAPRSAPEVAVLFESTPLGAQVSIDGERVCTTPCRPHVEAGVHHVSMRVPHHEETHARVTLSANSIVNFTLAKKPYNFFLMNDLSDFGSVLTTGVDPSDTKYRFITVLDGAHFAQLSAAIDAGVSGGVFGYRASARGSSWSIFGFGPSLRVGRLIATSHIELLSFRHRARDGASEGWRPGLTSRLQLPLLNEREAKGWAALLPVPTVGLDVWADKDLKHDETAFWVGLSWLHGSDF